MRLRASSPRARRAVRDGRGHDWLKVKCLRRQEVVIGGWTEPSGSRTAWARYVHEPAGGPTFAGKVGTASRTRSRATCAAPDALASRARSRRSPRARRRAPGRRSRGRGGAHGVDGDEDAPSVAPGPPRESPPARSCASGEALTEKVAPVGRPGRDDPMSPRRDERSSPRTSARGKAKRPRRRACGSPIPTASSIPGRSRPSAGWPCPTSPSRTGSAPRRPAAHVVAAPRVSQGVLLHEAPWGVGTARAAPGHIREKTKTRVPWWTTCGRHLVQMGILEIHT
jgi:hypothetical protein